MFLYKYLARNTTTIAYVILAENFLNKATKHGIQKEETKQLMKEIFYRVAYAPIVMEQNIIVWDLR